MRLFFASGCPYAQRTRALLTLLDQPFEPREIDLEAKPGDFLALSPTGAVPLLDDEGFVLFESAVVNEYLAEKFAWRDALPADVRERARHRLAMKRFDDVLAPLFFRALREPNAVDAHPTWRRELAYFAEISRGAPTSSLLGLHVAPHWLRMTWTQPDSRVVVELRAAAGPFLDASLSLPSIIATSPERAPTVAALLKKFG